MFTQKQLSDMFSMLHDDDDDDKREQIKNNRLTVNLSH